MHRSNAWFIAMVAIVFALLVFGSTEIWKYKLTPGAAGDTPQAWPSDTTLARDAGRPSVFLFAHPRCACTKATLSELRRVVSRVDQRAHYTVVFELPQGSPDGFLDSDNWREVGTIAGVDRVVDDEGREGKRFGALTSGHVVAYDAAGQLLFTGGITNARGHEGTNASEDRLLDALIAAAPHRSPLPIYGCELHTERP